ncbi:MAG: cytochrome c biogenesis protein CcdA, partial [Lentisphaerota bacterium]
VRREKPSIQDRWAEKFATARADMPLSNSGWSFSITTKDKQYVLMAIPPASFQGEIATAYFFPYDQGMIEHATTQVWTRVEDYYTLAMTRVESPDETPTRLAGVLVSPDPWAPPAPNMAAVVDVPLEKVVQTATAKRAPETTALPDEKQTSPGQADWKTPALQFKTTASGSGYMKSAEFLSFLEQNQSGNQAEAGGLEQRGFLVMILLIFFGGMALNLTPCVLPLIPINLAIIGAGAQAQSKGRGLALGGMYGLGMALAYGALGLVVVLTGSKFGTLNASPWFNAAIAGIFILLALAMFDIVTIDFTRFNPLAGKATTQRQGRFGMAFILGIVAALLAGACVAPVVISVLLLAGNLYSRGILAGLLLPFLLGLGMAAPWPIAGAGLSFLPKPGQWMVRVKYVFGALILGMALYYGHLSYTIFKHRLSTTSIAKNTTAQTTSLSSKETARLAEALAQASREGKPVFIDFWATWCKNCLAMEKTTFKEPEVEQKLAGFIVVKFQADDPSEPLTKQVLDHYGVIGLPTYVVLR